jgi:hypothetical protein
MYYIYSSGPFWLYLIQENGFACLHFKILESTLLVEDLCSRCVRGGEQISCKCIAFHILCAHIWVVQRFPDALLPLLFHREHEGLNRVALHIPVLGTLTRETVRHVLLTNWLGCMLSEFIRSNT